mmetsp:Transcript_12999/g.35413  ORF Transcript_12999/g.35413 Transcript_12999/m.35413 type:complete len:232 (-) Transcript_12999:538-1233(-)
MQQQCLKTTSWQCLLPWIHLFPQKRTLSKTHSVNRICLAKCLLPKLPSSLSRLLLALLLIHPRYARVPWRFWLTGCSTLLHACEVAIADHARHCHHHATQLAHAHAVVEVQPAQQQHQHCFGMSKHLEGDGREATQAHELADIDQHSHCTGEAQTLCSLYCEVVVQDPLPAHQLVYERAGKQQQRALHRCCVGQELVGCEVVFALHHSTQHLLHTTGNHGHSCNGQAQGVN